MDSLTRIEEDARFLETVFARTLTLLHGARNGDLTLHVKQR